MAIQYAGSVLEEIFKAKAPYLIPTEGNRAGTLGGKPAALSCSVGPRQENVRFVIWPLVNAVVANWTTVRSEELIAEFKSPTTRAHGWFLRMAATAAAT